MMKFQREIITPEEASRRVMAHVQLRETETVPLEDTLGRRLAETIYAANPVPHFRRSGMDGFALHAGDSLGASEQDPVTLTVTETIACGDVAKIPLRPGYAARIMTGAAVPDEADAVIQFEWTTSGTVDGKPVVRLNRPVAEGANISPVGLETKEGDLLLEAGRRIGPGETALLAMFGYPTVKVFHQPKVAVFATGSELLRVDEELQPGRIRNSNGYMIAAQVKEAGAIPVIMPTVPDDVKTAKEAILKALDTYDAVITTGGVSVGDFDILYDLTQEWDGQLLFNKISMRPGSPTTVGVRQGKLLFALSGNPGACFVGFELLAKPALLAMQGEGKDVEGFVEETAIMAVDYRKTDKFTKFLRGVRRIQEGRVLVEPVGIDASSITVSIRDSDCLIVVPPSENGVHAGDVVRVIPVGIRI